MGIFGFGKKKDVKLGMLEVMRLKIEQTEKEIKKINKDYDKMIEDRQNSSTYDYRVQGHKSYVSNIEADERNALINKVHKQLLEDLATMIIQFQKEMNR
jgi:hypothetical protein